MRTLIAIINQLIKSLLPDYVIARKRDIVIKGLALGIACRFLETQSNLTFDYWARLVGEEALAELKTLTPQQIDDLIEKSAAAKKKAPKSNFFAIRGR